MPIENQLINLNSANASQNNGTYLSNVYFNFTSLIVPNNNIKTVTCSILNAQIPYSYYNVNVYNNVFKISNSGATQTITLTRGNYNANTLITEIINQLTLAGISGISIVLSSITGCLTWTTSAASMTIYSSGSTALKFLGLSTTSNTTSVSQKITSPYPLNLLYTLKIRIASTALIVNFLDSAVSGSLNILSCFSVSAPNFGIILYENQTNIQSELKVRSLNGFDIQILDDDGNLINFNNTNWTATLMLQIDYEDEVIPTNPFINSDLGIPNQAFWGANPNPQMVPQPQQNETQSEPQNDAVLNETQATNDATLSKSEEVNNDTINNIPKEEINPQLDDNNDLAILMWNKHLNI